MAIRGFEKKDPMAGLNQLMQLMNQMGQINQRKQQNISSRASNLHNLLKATTDIDKMSALGERINNADITFDDMGDDETGDILKELYGTNHDTVIKGQQAVYALSGMKSELEIGGQESFDKVKNRILDEDWSVVNQNLRQLFVYQSQLEAAKGTQFRGSKELDPAMLNAVVTQYQSLYSNKLALLSRTGVYDIPDEDIQAFDEQFGVQLMSLSPTDFNKMMGQHQNYVQGLYANAESEANRYYDKMVKAENTGGSTVDWEVAGLDIGETLSAEEWRVRYNEKADLARKLNERHNQFYGSYFSDDVRFIKDFKEPDSFLSKVKQLKGDKEDTEIDKTTVKEQPPSAAITWDKDTNAVSIGAPEEKETLIQKGLLKVSNTLDIKQSLQDVEFRNKDGDIINISGYNKKTDSYSDANGKKYSKDELLINSDSLKNFKPKLKKANGDYYFFDPTKNQFSKWGSSSTFGNQTMEVFNGKEVPTIILSTQYGEGLVIG